MVKRLASALMGAIVALTPFAFTPALGAGAGDPAGARVDAFDGALIAAMKAGAAGAKARARGLTPAVESDFDLGAMTRFAVGPSWASMSTFRSTSDY